MSALDFRRPQPEQRQATEFAPDEETPHYDAATLTGGGHRAVIRLGNQIYLLRITRQGKLLLTK